MRRIGSPDGVLQWYLGPRLECRSLRFMKALSNLVWASTAAVDDSGGGGTADEAKSTFVFAIRLAF
jgi:hypothetical protein